MAVPAKRHNLMTELLSAWPFEGSPFHAPMVWPEFERMVAGVQTTPMRVEERVEDDTYVLRAELPGIDPDEDVEIFVQDGMVTIKAERHEEVKSEEEKGTYRTEFHYGSFSRTLPLPAGADESAVSASYADGILEVRVPVGAPETPEPRTVPITRG